MSADGVLSAEVTLPGGIRHFRLPDPPADAEFTAAVKVSLGLLDAAPDYITAPMLGAVWASLVGGADYSLVLAGPTGVGKSELAALIQQHFGAGFDARHLPGSWSSTANALEYITHSCKDAVLVVDDFAPAGTPQDVARMHRDADRLLRSQGNNTARERMTPEAGLRGAKNPRGLIVVTGEDVPRGQSLRARMLVLQIADKALDFTRLTECQLQAAAGVYARAVCGFVQWLAPRYGEARACATEEAAGWRERMQAGAGHRRTPTTIAHLMRSWQYFLRAALERDALTGAEVDAYLIRVENALLEAARQQGEQQGSQEPARRFIDLLRAAINGGEAHVACVKGGPPERPTVWGWRTVPVGNGHDWREQGKRVGWVDGEHLYLEPQASYAVAQRVGQVTGDALSITVSTLSRRLHEQGLLSAVDKTRKTLRVRKTAEGKRVEILHLRAGVIFQEDARTPGTQTDQTDHDSVDGEQEDDGYLS